MLDFAAHLRANNMPPRWCSWNGWRANYKGKPICQINLPLGTYDEFTWSVLPFLTHMSAYETQIMCEGLQNLIWDHQFICVHDPKSPNPGKGCSPDKGCAGGVNIAILGRAFKGRCGCRANPIIGDPDAAAVEGILKLLAFEQRARAGRS